MDNTKQLDNYRQQFKAELAAQLGTTPDTLPTSTTKAEAAKFLHLKNWRTLNVWHCNGRHGIAMLKVGKDTRPLTSWLLEMKLKSVSIAKEGA